MPSAVLQEMLAQVAQGSSVGEAAQRLGLTCESRTVDAHYDGKPVCQVTLPYVVAGHAVLVYDSSLDPEIAESRLQSLAQSLDLPVCLVYPQN